MNFQDKGKWSPWQGKLISVFSEEHIEISRIKAITKGFWGKVGVSRGKKLIVKSPGNYVPGSLVGHFITSVQHPSWRWKREWKQMTWLGGGWGATAKYLILQICWWGSKCALVSHKVDSHFLKTSYFVLGYRPLTNNGVTVSDEQWRDSAIHIHNIHSPPSPTPIQAET